jgi:hypothetical protein
MLLPSDLWQTLHGFDPLTSPHLEDSDLCLRGLFHHNISSISAGNAVGVTLLSHFTTIDTTPEYTSKFFSPLSLSSTELEALREFSFRWRELETKRKEANYLTPAKLTWVIHCGGSQGLEAATILQTLYKYPPPSPPPLSLPTSPTLLLFVLSLPKSSLNSPLHPAQISRCPDLSPQISHV